MTLMVRECSPSDPEVKPLILALSAELFRITGNDGSASFADEDVQGDRSIFLVALADGEPIGCGGLRPVTADVCEIKRMYAKYSGQGIGSKILQTLESYAHTFGYKEIWLETRKINESAVKFYCRHGYQGRPNYGKYVGRSEAVCFEKIIRTDQK